MAATCPECESDIDIDETDVDIGDEMSCSECGALLRVASEAPMELELADDDDEEEEDDDADDEEEDDEDADEDEDEDWGERDGEE